MFRFWKEESEDAQEAAAAGSQLRGEIDAAESDGGSPQAVEADELDLNESPSLLAGDDNESSPLFAGDDDEYVSPEPTEGEDGETADTEEAERPTEVPEADLYPLVPPSGRKTRRKARPQETTRQSFTPQQRLLLLDTWQRSGLPAKDFSALVGISQNSLYKWKRQFERLGPEGLLDQPKGARRGSRLPEVTKRTILMLKRSHSDWGCQRIGHFIDYYNFQRTHTGIEGLVPADRFFGATQDILQTLKGRVAANALELARHGRPKQPFYVTGQVSGQSFSVHSQGERLVLVRDGEKRQEIELTDPPKEEPIAQPKPVCPHAAPQSWPNEPAEMPPNEPGKTVFDEVADTAAPTEDSDQAKTSDQADEEGGRS